MLGGFYEVCIPPSNYLVLSKKVISALIFNFVLLLLHLFEGTGRLRERMECL